MSYATARAALIAAANTIPGLQESVDSKAITRQDIKLADYNDGLFDGSFVLVEASGFRPVPFAQEESVDYWQVELEFQVGIQLLASETTHSQSIGRASKLIRDLYNETLSKSSSFGSDVHGLFRNGNGRVDTHEDGTRAYVYFPLRMEYLEQ